jgi:hypothetical protein
MVCHTPPFHRASIAAGVPLNIPVIEIVAASVEMFR